MTTTDQIIKGFEFAVMFGLIMFVGGLALIEILFGDLGR